MNKWLILCGVVLGGAVAALVSFQFLSRPVASSPKILSPPVDIPALISKAQTGNTRAQARLAGLYVTGEAGTNSYPLAVFWYRKAVEQGCAEAQLGLGELYETGQGVAKDLPQAIKLYRQAAEQGLASAQYTLAFMQEAGRGLPQDQVEASKWFRRAAEQGHSLSQYDLGQRYDLGVGVPIDRVEALKWLILAADQGQVDAGARRDQVEKELTRTQITEAQRRAKEYSSKKTPPRAK